MAVIGFLEQVAERCAWDETILPGLRYLRGLPASFLGNRLPGYHERQEIDGDRLVALHQVYVTRDPADAQYEGHQRHVDLQYILAGRERIRLRSLRPGEAPGAYDADGDVAFLPMGGGTDLALEAGMVAVLYPEDLHAPGLHWGASGTVRKTVVKVRL
jgi:YhcH/YjgK/YiaL family protein